jgi:two-component system chemotaxis response regulator CheB
VSGVARSRGRGVSEGQNRETAKLRDRAGIELVVVGCSMGGMYALEKILRGLTNDFCVPIAVAQHRHRRSNEGLPSFLRRASHMDVVDVEDKQWMKPGTVYLAPADYHLLVSRGEFDLSVDDAVRHSRPSVDVLFESAADTYGPALIGIVLTGANADGAAGARRIKQRGGMVIVQDPETAEAQEMPRAVIATGAVDQILRLEEIAPFLVERCRLVLTP